jgi:predicted nucleic acid-binding protein
LDEGHTFVTTNFVLAEAITLIRYNLHHTAAVRFWHTLQQLIDAELVDLVRVNEIHEITAWEIFEQYDDQKFSYTDCTSFAVMRDRSLTRAFTADRHFSTMGFLLVP